MIDLLSCQFPNLIFFQKKNSSCLITFVIQKNKQERKKQKGKEKIERRGKKLTDQRKICFEKESQSILILFTQFLGSDLQQPLAFTGNGFYSFVVTCRMATLFLVKNKLYKSSKGKITEAVAQTCSVEKVFLEISRKFTGKHEFAKLRTLRTFALYASSCYRALCPLIFTRLNYTPCALYLLIARLTHSRYKISY